MTQHEDAAQQPTIDTKALRERAEKTPTSVMVSGNNGPIRIPNYVDIPRDTLLVLLDAYDAQNAEIARLRGEQPGMLVGEFDYNYGDLPYDIWPDGGKGPGLRHYVVYVYDLGPSKGFGEAKEGE